MDNLYLIIHQLNKELVQARRNTLIGMDPIAPKNQVVASLHLCNKESGSQGLAPN
jgi:hypothetical protein